MKAWQGRTLGRTGSRVHTARSVSFPSAPAMTGGIPLRAEAAGWQVVVVVGMWPPSGVRDVYSERAQDQHGLEIVDTVQINGLK